MLSSFSSTIYSRFAAFSINTSAGLGDLPSDITKIFILVGMSP